MRIIVGLGNPGREYAKTRHNVGFEVIDTLAERLAWTPVGRFDELARTRFDALAFEGNLDTPTGIEKVLLLKPQTFMNRSGRSVEQACRFYKVPATGVLVIVDEMNLPAGKLRLRADGSDGGHNGLRDLKRALGTTAFARLRIGVDTPPPPVAGKDYVLGKFSPEQRTATDAVLPRAAACCVAWADAGVERAMNEFNAG